MHEHARFSNEDPDQSGLEFKRILNAEGVVVLSAPSNLFVLRFDSLGSKDLGLYDLSTHML